uniref:Uncharacterized protein n=1 Tax=Anopheles minimus TaxID=112268 RepID=A0A182WGN7_9DIPT
QKLTSPKWNPFKGIRLRWKEKIRLNNVIWRCWHMQFIMKRKTLVCQFASPLDVDVHSTPQVFTFVYKKCPNMFYIVFKLHLFYIPHSKTKKAILLEGKYWKRKCNVIKAEYKKWRRFNVNRALGATNIVDTNEELVGELHLYLYQYHQQQNREVVIDLVHHTNANVIVIEEDVPLPEGVH